MKSRYDMSYEKSISTWIYSIVESPPRLCAHLRFGVRGDSHQLVDTPN
jgi:hypothetical protein